MPPAAVHLMCAVAPLAPHVAAGFETEFCEALRANLSRDLGVPFALVSPGPQSDGMALRVAVEIISQSRASVTASYGRMQGGQFTPGSSESVELSSVDRPLRPASSRTLVRGIGIQMGLVKQER